jgi:hypothetical protein
MFVVSPLQAYSNLASGIIILTGFFYSILKIHQGSKSETAYILLMFTIGYALQDLGDFLIALFP